MKRIIIAIGLALLAASATFAQGVFWFSGNTKTVWDNFSGYSPRVTTTASIDVAFLIGAGTPAIASIAPSIPTNNESMVGVFYAYNNAWDKILHDPNYHLATNDSVTVVAAVNSSNGAWEYNGGSTFLDPSTTGGGAYTVYVIGWDATAGATPQAAAASGYAAVGWSVPFSYTTGNNAGSPPTSPQIFSSSVTPFGIGPQGVPEPGTLALAGTGLASLLAFRRRGK